MFCPNCGTQNDSAATPCKKCGFKLSGISVPKFKGTMMLNSDQTVAEMVEEHRKKQVPAGAADKNAADKNAADKLKARASEPAPRRGPGSSAPPSSLGGPRGPVLQPPRAAAPTRGRMGGTMLGVAPQVGGYHPARGATGSTGTGSPAAVPPATEVPNSESSRSDAASGSEAAPLTPPSSDPPDGDEFSGAVESASRLPSPVAQAPAPEPAPTLAPTGAWTATPAEGGSSAPTESDASVAEGPVEPAAAPARAVALTAPLPRVTGAALAERGAEPAAPEQASVPAPARLKPIDIVLIVCTFGIYGLVLWARQRRPAA